jgi:hypothetical protein
MVAPYIDDGTQLMQLKPSSILGAAEEDVVRFRRNTSRHGSMKAAGWGNTQHGRLIAAPALVSN